MNSLPTKSTQHMPVVHDRKGEQVQLSTSFKENGVTLLRQRWTRRSTRPTSGRMRKWEPPWSREGLHGRGLPQKQRNTRENRCVIGVPSMVVFKRNKRMQISARDSDWSMLMQWPGEQCRTKRIGYKPIKLSYSGKLTKDKCMTWAKI